MFDAIIVGARCAGSPLGMLLARQGHRVLVVDRDSFPSDTLSTTYFQPEASAALDRRGLYERLMATGVPAGPMTLTFGTGFSMPGPDGPYPGIAPRRTYLDKILVDAAREAGADVREDFSVQEIRRDESGRVIGIRGRDADGNAVVEDARIVVGADGRNSLVARTVGAEEYAVHEPTTCAFFSYFTGAEDAAFEFHYNGRHVFFTFPTNDDQVCIAGEAPFDAWQEFRADPGQYLFSRMRELAPALYDRVKDATVAERWFGMQGRRSFYRVPYGDGWALAGDAGFLKDPITGTGCDDAFRDAGLLSEALHAWLTGAEEYETALAAYQSKRDEASMPAYQRTCFLAGLHEVTPEFMQQLAAGTAGQPA